MSELSRLRRWLLWRGGRGATVTAVVLAPLLLAACFLLPSTSHSFRITLNAEVDGQPKSASSVYRITITKFPSPSGWQLDYRIEGDAVFLDLGEGRNILVLVARGSGWYANFALLARDVFLPNAKRNNLEEVRELSRLQGSATLSGEALPHLGILRTLADPRSLQVVTPADISPIFGGRVHFRSAMIEMTRAHVTRGIEKRLPWLSDMKAKEEQEGVTGKPGQLPIYSGLFTRS